MSEFNRLKSISEDIVEKAIAKALSELAGIEYDCSISNITYNAIEQTKFDVAVSMHTDMFKKSKSI